MRRRTLALVALVSLRLGVGPALGQEEAATLVQSVLATARHPWLKWPDFSDQAADMRALYAGEGDGLVWFENDRLHPATGAAVEALVWADTRGLSPVDYDAPLLLVRFEDIAHGEAAGDVRALFDLGLSLGLLRHFSDVHRGRVDPRTVGFAYDAHGADLDLPRLVRGARDEGTVAEAVERLEPQYPVYKRLKAGLARWTAVAKGPSLVTAPEVRKLAPGDEYDGLLPLAARLAAFGDLPPEAPAPSRYEGPLVEAVKRLQERWGLEADGTLGRATFRALNRSPKSLVEQIELALERLRWLPDLGGRDVVAVNIPAFRLGAFEADRGPALSMRVVVGKAMGHTTPVFYAEMTYLTFRPYWSVPYRIATRELLPKIRGDLGYLDREDLELVDAADPESGTYPPTLENLDLVRRGALRLRQRPGDRNSLGRVVFSFPNEDNIYMHDTPARELFARSRRDFSHGCIRLEDPVALVRWVLRDRPEWTEERIAAALEAPRPTWVGLARPLPVVIFYATAFVDGEGRARFFEDIYGLDERLREALAHGYPYPRAAAR
jgi:murein L,D-transpeptidase YcbB/YkuD